MKVGIPSPSSMRILGGDNLLSIKKTQEDNFGFAIGIAKFQSMDVSGSFRFREFSEIKAIEVEDIPEIQTGNLETIVVLSNDVSSSALENHILSGSFDVVPELIVNKEYPVVKDLDFVQRKTQSRFEHSEESSIPIRLNLIPYEISYTSMPQTYVVNFSYSNETPINYSESVSYSSFVSPSVYNDKPRIYYEVRLNEVLPYISSKPISYTVIPTVDYNFELEVSRQVDTYESKTTELDYHTPEITQTPIFVGEEAPSTKYQAEFSYKPSITTIVNPVVESNLDSIVMAHLEFDNSVTSTVDYTPNFDYLTANITLSIPEAKEYVQIDISLPDFSDYQGSVEIDISLPIQKFDSEKKDFSFVEESPYLLENSKDIECAAIPVIESYSSPDQCLSVLNLDKNDASFCPVVPEMSEIEGIDVIIQGDKAELTVCPVIPELEERFYIDKDSKVKWFSLSKTIINPTNVKEGEYHIKVKGSVEFDRPFYESKSGDYVILGNSVVAVVDKILRDKNLVPVWEVPYEISSEKAIQGGQIYLKDIMGVDQVASNAIGNDVDIDYIVEITDRITFERTLVSMQDLIQQEYIDTGRYAIDIIAQARTASKKQEKAFVEEIEQGYHAPTLKKLQYNSEIKRSEPGEGRHGLNEFNLNVGEVYDIVIMLQGHYDRNAKNMQGAYSVMPIEITSLDLSNNSLYVMEVKDSYGFDSHYLTNANSSEAIFDRKFREQGFKPVFMNFSTRRDEQGTEYQTGEKDNHVTIALMGVQGAITEMLNLEEGAKPYNAGILVEKMEFANAEIKDNYLGKIKVETTSVLHE